MRSVRLALPLLALCAGCATMAERPPLGVAEVVERHHELNGRLVRVRGWLNECHGLSCGLHETRTGGANLSIGYSRAFDRQAQSLPPAEIVLEARLRAVCFNDPMPPGVVEVCADRVDQLRPVRIVRVLARGE